VSLSEMADLLAELKQFDALAKRRRDALDRSDHHL
jgi:hypothetical protein